MKDLPPVTNPLFLARVREAIMSFLGKGDAGDRAVTVDDLAGAGIITRPGTGSLSPGEAIDPTPDLTPPPPPTGFIATAGTTNILFETDPPVFAQGHGHARTFIYAANYSGTGPLPTFADAVEYVSFIGNVHAAPFDPASNLHLWAKWLSVDGILGPPAGGTNGITANTNLIDDAKIANLSVSKLLAGSISVGQYIQSADYVAATSGWRIQTLGTGSAFLEVNGGAVIGGAVIGATFLQSSNYSLNTAGWRLKSDGTGQIGAFAVTNDGIQSTNYVVDTTGWKLKNDGTGQIGAFKVTTTDIRSVNYVLNSAGWLLKNDGTGQIGAFVVTNSGIQSTNFVSGTSGWRLTNTGNFEAQSGTFAGALSGATGTFSGTLTAAVVDTANIVGAAVTTNYASTANGSTSVSVPTVPSGSSSLAILADPGWVVTGGGETSDSSAFPDQLTLVVNGTTVISRAGFGMHIISSPSGSYSISASRGASTLPVKLLAMLTKR